MNPETTQQEEQGEPKIETGEITTENLALKIAEHAEKLVEARGEARKEPKKIETGEITTENLALKIAEHAEKLVKAQVKKKTS